MARLYEIHGIPYPSLEDSGPPEYAVIRDEDEDGTVFWNPSRLRLSELRHWGSVGYWTALEAALLFEGISPDDDELYAVEQIDMTECGLESFYRWKYALEFARASRSLFLLERSSLAPRAAPLEWVKYHRQNVWQAPESEFHFQYYNGWLEYFRAELGGSYPAEKVELIGSDKPGRREMQHEVILAVIAALDYDAQQIPYLGKSIIRDACLTRPRLFTNAENFKRAWQEGLDKGLFKTANHEKFSPK